MGRPAGLLEEKATVMTITAPMTDGEAAAVRPGPLGQWVEAHAEPCRGGRTWQVLVNHRTSQVIELTGTEAQLCRKLNAGQALAASPATTAFVAELREQGFLASDPPSPKPGRTVQLSAARLELRWSGAGRLVSAAYRHGARYLFHPAALAAQVLLAVTGMAALAVTLTSRQHFVLRVHPGQIPLVIALSLAAVAVHELAHALVVIRHHRHVDAAGIRLHLGTPAFYVESASAVLLTRRVRLAQAAAGVWAEWQFTSLIAIWLWLCPPPSVAPLLHRFVILNAITIATNLLPFTGLDGAWLVADATAVPDLARSSRGALTRLITARATRQPISSSDKALAAYAAANGLAAAALLGTAAFFWYQLFGDLAATLIHHGPAGWAALAVAAIVLGRPAVTATAARLPAAAATARDLRDAIAFRLQWRWRVPATRQLAALPQLTHLSAAELGILAGQLRRTRHRGPLPASLAGSYGIVLAGAITTATGQTLTRGNTWTPQHRPRHATHRATLIHTQATGPSVVSGPSAR
jgi:hypothetical protein